MLKIETPRDSDIHSIADFIELLCLLTPDRIIGADSIADHVKDNGGNLSSEELEDSFSHLRWRSAAFGDSYPFSIDSSRNIIESSQSLGPDQSLYAFILLCANLPAVRSQSDRILLTDTFERLCLSALRKIWPGAQTKPFGKNETEYSGKKWERINKLGQDIGARPQLSPKSYRSKDSGDGGIDIVSWIPLDDYEQENIPSSLSQCACSREDWVSKQAEVSGDRLKKLLVPTHPWMQVICIPICFRNNQGRWAFDGDVASTILLDRLRILRLTKENNAMQSVGAPQIFSDFLSARLDLV